MNLIDCDDKFAADTIFVIWSVTHKTLECEYGAVFSGAPRDVMMGQNMASHA